MITLRKGTKEDAPFIAQMIMTALHLDYKADERLYGQIVRLVKDDKTLYSWHRCVLAVDGETCAGLCLAYDAKDYHERRVRSFTMPYEDGTTLGEEDRSLLEQEDEAGEGEFYIDSLAVAPEYRKQGTGRMLMLDAINRGKELGLSPTLLVDPENPGAIRLYSSLGFRYKRDMFAFGQTYHKYHYQ